jgi:membrane fusion protein
VPDNAGFFRTQVLHASTRNEHGDVVLTYPVSNYLLLLGGLAALAIACCFLALGKYTRHVSISGVLEPTMGVVKLYASQNGTLKSLHVHEGQVVRKGDVLLDFEWEHTGGNGVVAEADIDQKLTRQLNALHSERSGTLQLNLVDLEKSKLSLIAQEQNLQSLRADIEHQEKRVQADEQTVMRYENLQKSGFISDLQAQDKKNELTDQRLRLVTMHTDLVNANAEVARLKIELSSTPLRGKVARDQLDRTISNLEAELTKQQIGRIWKVTAPCDGIVTAIAISKDQNAASGSPLISIVPSNSALQATLYAPSRALGFIQPAQPVELRMDAFPFQKFGTVLGKVRSIADTPLNTQERSSATRLATSVEASEPVYTIRVELESQMLIAYGKAQRLRPGLQFEADVQLETRRLYEWLLEPLYSLRRA